MNLLKLQNISKTFDTKAIPALRGIGFSLQKKEHVSLLGPSGTGKTTLLKIIMGMIPTDEGSVETNGSKISFLETTDSGPEDQKVSEYIQELILGSNLQKENRMREMIELFSLFYKEHRFLNELSLGQRKRAAFARALAPRPDVLLMDEPFANLDDFLKRELRYELFKTLDEQGISSLFVTHDIDEALGFSDRCLFLDDGEIRQQGNPFDLYHYPRDSHVARFFGPCNLFSCPLEGKEELHFEWGKMVVPNKSPFLGKGARHAYLMVRPHEWMLTQLEGIKVRILGKKFFGEMTEYLCDGGLKNLLYLRLPPSTTFETGEIIYLLPDPKQVRLIPV